MAKISIDIEHIKTGLRDIGYEISDCIQRENNGINWQLKFNNSGAIVTIYDSNKMKNSVVNGKPDDGEKEKLKEIVDGLKCNELVIDPLNSEIVNLIRTRKEDYFYDFKQIPHEDKESLLHDILCLSNNVENKDAYLILGVDDDYSVVGVDDSIKSNNIFDFLKPLSFDGDKVPEISVFELLYKYKRVVAIKCQRSKNVPFYLTKRYKGINDHQIYNRIGDTNTPKNSQANYSDVEKLWKIHFSEE